MGFIPEALCLHMAYRAGIQSFSGGTLTDISIRDLSGHAIPSWILAPSLTRRSPRRRMTRARLLQPSPSGGSFGWRDGNIRGRLSSRWLPADFTMFLEKHNEKNLSLGHVEIIRVSKEMEMHTRKYFNEKKFLLKIIVGSIPDQCAGISREKKRSFRTISRACSVALFFQYHAVPGPISSSPSAPAGQSRGCRSGARLSRVQCQRQAGRSSRAGRRGGAVC